MFGYEVVEVSPNRKYSMARLEKALLDYLYLHPRVSAVADFAGLRWSREELLPLVNGALFQGYLSLFDKRALAGGVEQLRRYLDA